MANFEIQDLTIDKVLVLKIVGELDALVAPQLREKIEKELELGHKKIGLDLSELVHINSLAMGILRGELKKIREIGGDMKLFTLSEHITELFEMVGLDEIFEIYKTQEEAINSFK